MQPFGDARQIVLEPVSHKDRFPICGFDEILQSIQLAVVYLKHAFVLPIDGPVCHLGELVRKGCGVSGIDLLIAQGNDQFRAHGIVGFAFLLGKCDLYLVHHAFWHLQVVCRLHGDGDVRDSVVDFLFRAGQRFVAEHHLPVALVRLEEGVAVMGDEPAEPLAHIENAELCPQIHKPVAAGCAGQPNDAFDTGADFQQTAESLCLIALEGGQFINDHHIIVEGNAALFNEPLDILPVDDVHADPLPECRLALCFCTDSHRVGQPMQMIPLVDLRRPCISGDTERRNDKHLANQKAVQAEVEDGRKGNHAFSKTHVEEHSRYGMLQYEVGGISLVVMRTVFH